MTRDDVAAEMVSRVLVREGGVADVGDGKGVTRYGQTAGWLAQFGLPEPANAMQAAANYLTWIVRTKLIVLCDVADDLCDCTIDFAVNAGHRVAIHELQAAMRLATDGVIGPETEAAIARADRPKVARLVLAGRLRFYGSLLGSDVSKQRFARGWLNRVAAQVEALA